MLLQSSTICSCDARLGLRIARRLLIVIAAFLVRMPTRDADVRQRNEPLEKHQAREHEKVRAKMDESAKEKENAEQAMQTILSSSLMVSA